MIVETKENKNAVAVKTNLTLIFDDANTERALAQSAAIVRIQAAWRKNGIPTAATVKLSDLKAGLRAEVMTPEAIKARAAIDPAFRAQVLKELGL